jgi:membrane protein
VRLVAGEEFRGLVRVLGHFVAAQRDGRGLDANELRVRESFLDDTLIQRYLTDLDRARLIQRSEGGDFVLVRDVATTTLFELYAACNYRLPLQDDLPAPSMEDETGAGGLPLEYAAAELRRLWNLPIGEMFPAPARSDRQEIPPHVPEKA